MEKESLFDKKIDEANIKLNRELEDAEEVPSSTENSGLDEATAANLKIVKAFEGGRQQDDPLPTYVNHETAAVKISGKQNR